MIISYQTKCSNCIIILPYINIRGAGAPRNFAQGMMVNTAYRIIFADKIFLNMAIPLKKGFKKVQIIQIPRCF